MRQTDIDERCPGIPHCVERRFECATDAFVDAGGEKRAGDSNADASDIAGQGGCEIRNRPTRRRRIRRVGACEHRERQGGVRCCAGDRPNLIE